MFITDYFSLEGFKQIVDTQDHILNKQLHKKSRKNIRKILDLKRYSGFKNVFDEDYSQMRNFLSEQDLKFTKKQDELKYLEKSIDQGINQKIKELNME